MSKKIDKELFVDTVKFQIGLLIFYVPLVAYVLIFSHFSLKSILIGVSLGIFLSVILPFSWKRNKEWAGAVFAVFPCSFLGGAFQEDFSGLKAVLIAVTLTALVFLIFKKKVIAYILEDG